jgi:predicted short-subunit dehydrogenase-like oxidoreductase (DUF2520 family)
VKFFLVGPGKVGIALSALLVRSGHELAGCWSRSGEGCLRCEKHLGLSPSTGDMPRMIGEVDFILITASESALPELSRMIGRTGFLHEGQMLLHTSGLYPAAALEAASGPGIHLGSLHPAQSIPSVEAGLALLKRSLFTVEGDVKAVELGSRLVEDIGGRALPLEPAAKPLYHCSLATASNFLVLLAWLSGRMLVDAGIDEGSSRELVRTIMKGTQANLERMKFEDALTGPVLRGDWQTVKAHLDTLKSAFPEALPLYRAASRQLITISRERKQALDRIAGLIQEEKGVDDGR